MSSLSLSYNNRHAISKSYNLGLALYNCRALEYLHRLPSMESESDHDHRDDESVSEQEEIEETKPKSALKKGREPVAPVERPELPYVSQ